MIFKTDRIREEFAELTLGGRNPALAAVMLYADHASELIANRAACVTSIFRTRDEQRAICDRLEIAPYRSVHEFWRGFDLRRRDYTDEEAQAIVAMVTSVFSYGGSLKVLSAKPHGTSAHFHGQAPTGSRWVMK